MGAPNAGGVGIGDFWQIIRYNSKTVQDWLIVFSEVICALTNGVPFQLPWVTHNPQTTTISTFCVAFYIFLVNKHKDFKLGMHVDHSKSQSAKDRLSLKEVPIKYLWNGFKFCTLVQFWLTMWSFSLRIDKYLIKWSFHGHVISLNFW